MDKLSKIRIRYIIGATLLIGVVALVALLYSYNNPTYPKFSYNSSQSGGWWASDNTNLQAMADTLGERYQGTEPKDKLPVADLTVHHGTPEASEAPADSCFVAYSYFNYPLASLDDAYKEYEQRKDDQGTLKILEPTKQMITTFEGEKGYELRSYDYTIEGQDVLSGYQIGFISMSEGYVRVEGVCKTADDLALTSPILQSVHLLAR